MRAGDLVDICRWHKRVVEVQRSGAVKETYVDMGDIRCSIKPPQGVSKVLGDRLVVDDNYKVYARHHYDVREFDHIVIDDVVYYVDYVSHSRRAGMIILTIKREQQ